MLFRSGMVVEALYTNGVVCTITGYTVSPMSLTDNVTTVIVSFAEAGIIRTVGQEVAVLPILAGIEIASAPDKTQYFYLESFDSTGMVVNAIYSNGFKESVPGFTCQETTFNAIGTHEVIISYTKDGITKTTVQTVSVSCIPIDVPTQSGTLIYNGSEQSPAWNNYNASKMTIGGVTSKTDAGSYNVIFIPETNYCWTDGSTSAKTVVWSISKAACSMSLSKTNIILNENNTYEDVVVTWTGNNEFVEAVTSNSNVARCAMIYTGDSIAQIRISSVATSGANHTVVTVTVEANDNYNAPESKTIDVTTNGNKICFVDDTYGNYNAINGSFTMNPASGYSSCTNAGGWKESHMRNTVLGSANNPASPTANTFMAALPSDLRAVMKPCTKYSDNTGGTANTESAVTATADYLWLLSEFEIQGTRKYANQYEQNSQMQYDYYKAGNKKVFYRHNADATTAICSLRSVFEGYAYAFCAISTSGAADRDAAGHSRGISLCFSV